MGVANGKSLITRTAALLAVAIFLCLASASSALGEVSYIFEPTLSLTGDCSKSIIDPVEDPGCPGGKHPPSGRFDSPGVTVDSYGDIYVVNIVEKESRIDIFSSKGLFISELKDPAGAQSIAVDSKGNLYVFEAIGEKVRRFPPTVYKPEEGEIKYEEPSVLVAPTETFPFKVLGSSSVAVDSKDLLYIDRVKGVSIFSSAEEGNKLLEADAIKVEQEEEAKPVPRDLNRSTSSAVDSAHKKIYLSDKIVGGSIIRVFELEAPHKELGQIDGSTTPKPPGRFLTGEGFLAIDVDDATGTVFVGDIEAASKVYAFEEDGTYLATIENSFNNVPYGEIAVADGPFVPEQRQGYLFVPSDPSQGHVYAFEPKEECEPELEAALVGDVTETEATLRATINPCGLETEYRLEYLSQQQWEEEGKSFANAIVAGEGRLSKGGEGVEVSAPALELEPGAKYRFRAFAENAKGEVEKERAFETFPPKEPPQTCENKAFALGLSVLLPDCRAYEVVTPPSTDGRKPTGGFFGYGFPYLRSAADGNDLSFLIEGGALPGTESAGSFDGDPYLASRSSDGWSSSPVGPKSQEAIGPKQRGLSPDQAYSFWQAAEDVTVRLHYPDGHSELVGRGSLGEDPAVDGNLITEDGSHVVFTTKGGSAVQLEPNAPPAGTGAVYDRSAAGSTHVVSLLPGNITPAAKEEANYLGASEEGEGIAFEIKGTIYLRLHNAETFKAAGPGTTFAGVADEGNRVFYLEAGDLFAFDAEEEKSIPFSSSGDITPVNVSTGGTRAYFVSPSVLTGEPDPNGEEAEAGEENLYLSEEGAISFIGIVTERDVEGEATPGGQLGGLGLWINAIELKAPAKDPSRTTPSGTTFLFESRADLTGFESEGFAQVYRYDSEEGRLDCLSCSPTGTPPTSDASLQSIQVEQFSLEPAGAQLKIPSQSPDGKRAFFQTPEPLVISDTDEQLDVYEWEEKEVGSCKKVGGCVYLISGGHSESPDYLFAMSSNGDDVFFRTADQLLLPRDTEATLSIYDARVNGGFPEAQEEIPCVTVDTCQGSPTPPPILPPPPTSVVGPDSNVPPPSKNCPKGKHKAKRHGSTVCVKNHKKKHHGRAGSDGKGGAR